MIRTLLSLLVLLCDLQYMRSDALHRGNVGTTGDESNGNQNWYDCSSEIGIPEKDAVVTFTAVRSDPAVVTPKSGQTILKTIHYVNHTSSDPALNLITVDFHQYYKLFGKKWITFLVVHNVDECKEHHNLCPLLPRQNKKLVTVHPPLNKLTPFGWYRSRQIYKDGESGRQIGCVDMSFEYARENTGTSSRNDAGWSLRGAGEESNAVADLI